LRVLDVVSISTTRALAIVRVSRRGGRSWRGMSRASLGAQVPVNA